MLRKLRRAAQIITLVVCITGFIDFAGGKAAEASDTDIDVTIVTEWVAESAQTENEQNIFEETWEDIQSQLDNLYILSDVSDF